MSICSVFLAENLGCRQFLEKESYPPNFPAANGCPKIIADLIRQPTRRTGRGRL